jgi:hypothetical protein
MEHEVKDSIYKNLNISKYDIVIAKRGDKPPICFGELVDALFIHKTGKKTIQSLGRSEQTFNRLVKKLFPSVSLQGGGETWLSWLIKQSDYKECSNCASFILRSNFTNLVSEHDGLDRLCIKCKSLVNKQNYIKNKEYYQNYWKIHGREKSARRRAHLLKATPRWANLEKIKQIYLNCPEGFHVDHIYPLKGKNICGLHVENNLQYLTIKENLSKGNKVPLLAPVYAECYIHTKALEAREIV